MIVRWARIYRMMAGTLFAEEQFNSFHPFQNFHFHNALSALSGPGKLLRLSVTLSDYFLMPTNNVVEGKGLFLGSFTQSA